MKRVFIQVVDPVHKTNEQASLIVGESKSLDEACLHLGFDSNSIVWTESEKSPFPGLPAHRCMCGCMEKSSKLVTYIEYSE